MSIVHSVKSIFTAEHAEGAEKSHKISADSAHSAVKFAAFVFSIIPTNTNLKRFA